MTNTNLFVRACLLVATVGICACDKDNSTDTGGGTTTTVLPDVYKKIYGASSAYVDGNFVVIKANGIPDHKSPYFATTDSRYEAYNGANAGFALNPNRIATQNYTFKIPLNPAAASTKTSTSGGPIGVSLNGVPFFNQYAAMNAPLTNEINGFDQYFGHPQVTGAYHYHIEPIYLTTLKGKAALLGFLLDGFPVYGPVENGVAVTNAQLDVYHGHTHATEDYPGGIYHYHITAADPYLNGNQYYGTPGSVTQ
jgi:hypothetical protein